MIASRNGEGTDPRRRGQPRAGADLRIPAPSTINHGFPLIGIEIELPAGPDVSRAAPGR